MEMTHTRSSTRFVSVAACLIVVAGCTAVLDGKVEDQCSTDDDCIARGASFAGTKCTPQRVCTLPAPQVDGGDEDAGPVDPLYGCVGKTTPTKIEPDVPIRFQWKFLGGLSGEPLANVKYKVCTGLDTGCSTPIAEGATAADGVIDVPLSKGFRGFMELSGGPNGDLQPSLFYFKPPEKDVLVGPPETQANLLSVGEFAFLIGSLAKEAKPEYGHVFGLTLDCSNVTPAAGVTLDVSRVSNDSFPYYTDDNRTPTLTQTSTSTRGEAGYVNLPPGTVTLNYSRQGQSLGNLTVVIRPNYITYAPMYPQ